MCLNLISLLELHEIMEVLKYITSQCLFCLVVFLSCIVNTAFSDVLQSILWAPYNPFFRNLGDSARTVFLNDQLIFICPNKIIYLTQTNEEYNPNNLHANIYVVDEQGFKNCNATGGKQIVLCDDPSSCVKSANVRILENAPLENMPQFQPGKLHYFIDTSDGSKNNVSNLVGGKCRTDKMKMKVYVCKDDSDPLCPNKNKVTNGGWSSWGECSQSGTQTRQCNNPVPSNGGFGCQGNHTRACTTTDISPTPTTVEPKNNETITPKRDKRTSVADTLGTLSVGEVVGIFIAIFIFGFILGLFIGVVAARIKSRAFPLRRRKGNLVDQFNRNSITGSSAPKPRPFSTISNDTTLTNITGFTSYNDIYDEAK